MNSELERVPTAINTIDYISAIPSPASRSKRESKPCSSDESSRGKSKPTSSPVFPPSSPLSLFPFLSPFFLFQNDYKCAISSPFNPPQTRPHTSNPHSSQPKRSPCVNAHPIRRKRRQRNRGQRKPRRLPRPHRTIFFNGPATLPRSSGLGSYAGEEASGAIDGGRSPGRRKGFGATQ